MPGASQSIVIHASPKEVFRVIADFESYPLYLPETKKVLIEKRSGQSVVATFTVNVIKTINYTLKFKLQAPKKITWSLVQSDLFKANSGSWVLEAQNGGDSTKASYAVDIDLGLMIPAAITRLLVGSNLPRMLSRIKARVESNRGCQGNGE